MLAVGHRRIDLDAAVHRPRMHDDRIGLGERELVRGQAVVLEEFAGGRQQRAFHALALQAQHHDHVAAGETLAHVVEDAHAHASRPRSAAASAGRSTRTSGVPSVVRPWISERATRECSTSPTIATVSARKSCL